MSNICVTVETYVLPTNATKQDDQGSSGGFCFGFSIC